MLIQKDNFSEILNLAVKIELEKERHNTVLDQLVDELLVVAQKAEEPGIHVNWTPQKFSNERLSEELRSVYQYNHGDTVADLYRLGAEIMNFTQDWNLKCIPMVKHIFWTSGSNKLFGINLLTRHPRFAVFYVADDSDIRRDEVEKFVPNCKLTSFPQYKQLRFQRGTKLTKLHALFKEIYSRRRVKEKELSFDQS